MTGPAPRPPRVVAAAGAAPDVHHASAPGPSASVRSPYPADGTRAGSTADGIRAASTADGTRVTADAVQAGALDERPSTAGQIPRPGAELPAAAARMPVIGTELPGTADMFDAPTLELRAATDPFAVPGGELPPARPMPDRARRTADPAPPARTGGGGSGRRRGVTAVAGSVLDQGVAAFTNIIVLVVAARLSTAAGFSVFSMVYMVFTVLLGVNVSYVGQALVLERGTERVRAACRSAVAFTATASAVLGWGLGAALLVLGRGPTARGLAVLGLVLPIVLTQDGMRYCFSALRLPHLALAADTVRLLVAVPALALQPHGTGAVRLVAVWGLSGVPALLTGAELLRRRLRGARADIRPYLRRGHLGQRFVVEFGVGNATSQLAVVGLGLFAAPLAVGALRGATTLFGPMNVLFNSATAFGPPLLNRVPGTRGKVRATAVLAVATSAVAVGWTAVLMLLPVRAGRQLLGDTWAASSALLPASGSQYAFMALGTSALLTLRVLRPRATLPIQVTFSLASVAFMLGGYGLDGVLGAAWGLALGSALKALALWLRIGGERRAGGDGAPRPAGGPEQEAPAGPVQDAAGAS